MKLSQWVTLKPGPGRVKAWFAHVKQPHGGRARKYNLDATTQAAAVAEAERLELVRVAAAAHDPSIRENVRRDISRGVAITIERGVELWGEALGESGLARGTTKRLHMMLSKVSRVAWIKGKKVTDITLRDLDRYLNDKKSQRRIATRVLVRHALCRFFQWLVDAEYIDSNPSLNLKVDRHGLPQGKLLRKETQPVTESDFRKVLSSMQPTEFWWIAAQMSWHGGLRLGDIALLEWDNIKDDRIVVGTRKSGEEVEYPITPELRDVLKFLPPRPDRRTGLKSGATKYRGEQLEGRFRYVWPEWASRYNTDNSNLSHQFSRRLARVGVHGKSFHGIRHTFAMRTRLAEAENAAAEVERLRKQLEDILATRNTAKKMGHRDLKSTMIYLNHPKS